MLEVTEGLTTCFTNYSLVLILPLLIKTVHLYGLYIFQQKHKFIERKTADAKYQLSLMTAFFHLMNLTIF